MPEGRSTIPKYTQRRENSGEEWPRGPALPAWGSSLSLGGSLCRVAGPELCSSRVSGDPQGVPHLPPSRACALPLPPRGASWPPQFCSPALSFIAILERVLGDSSLVPISGRSPESLAGIRGRPGWAADQDCRQRPQSRVASGPLSSSPWRERLRSPALPLREHLLHVGWTANNRSTG